MIIMPVTMKVKILQHKHDKILVDSRQPRVPVRPHRDSSSKHLGSSAVIILMRLRCKTKKTVCSSATASDRKGQNIVSVYRVGVTLLSLLLLPWWDAHVQCPASRARYGPG